MLAQSKELQCLIQTLEIRQDNGFDFPNSLDQFKIDIKNSALFQRLLSGKLPLTDPPPKNHGTPWYSLIEDGYGFPIDVWEANTVLTPYQAIGIDQSLWHLTDKISDAEYIIQYVIRKRGDPIAQYRLSNSLWRVFIIGQRKPPILNLDNNLWKIEKILDI